MSDNSLKQLDLFPVKIGDPVTINTKRFLMIHGERGVIVSLPTYNNKQYTINLNTRKQPILIRVSRNELIFE